MAAAVQLPPRPWPARLLRVLLALAAARRDALNVAIEAGQFGGGGARRLRRGGGVQLEFLHLERVEDCSLWCVRCLPESAVDSWPPPLCTAGGRVAQVSARLEP